MHTHEPAPAGAHDLLLHAVEAIYSCATTPAGFERLPRTLAPVLAARNLTIWCIDSDLDPAAAGNCGLPESGVRECPDHWVHDDPLLRAGVDSRIGRIATPAGLLGKGGFEMLPVFEGFYRPCETVRAIARFGWIQSRWISGLVFHRGYTDAPIDSDDQYKLEVLARHLRRALFIALTTGRLSARAEGAEELLSSCRLASWLIDANRRVYASNDAAEHLASTRDSGVVCSLEALRFSDPGLDGAFRQTLKRLESTARIPVDLPLPGASRRSFRWAVVIPVDHDWPGSGNSQRMYVLLVARPGADDDIDRRQLERRLPISPTEADVLARLMRAESPPAIADARGSTLETIRSYEKSLRTKLGCHGRAELVAQGWRTVAAIPGALESGAFGSDRASPRPDRGDPGSR